MRNLYGRWRKGFIEFSGYGKDFGKDIRKLRYGKDLVVISARILVYLGVLASEIERGKQKGVRVFNLFFGCRM